MPINSNQTTQTRLEALVDSLLSKAERAVSELDAVTVTCREKVKDPETGRETNREHQEVLEGAAGLIDRSGLKQLTAVLKDIRDILDSESTSGQLEIGWEEAVHELAQ